MKLAQQSPFESEYGFKGPGFSVDTAGNIIANSISTATAPTSGDSNIVDFTVTGSNDEVFISEQGVDAFPTLTLARQSSYLFDLSIASGFYIYNTNQTDLYSTGLVHSAGDTLDDAQGEVDGQLRLAVSIDAPDVLYYTDIAQANFGTINITDPQGVFGTVELTGQVASTSTTTGTLKIDGGLGMTGDMYVGGTLNVAGTGISDVLSSTNLNLGATNEIVFKIDNVSQGTLSTSGLSLPLINTSINNTTIGSTTPSTAAFTSATVSSTATTANDVANKGYVDTTATALAIAFGL